MTHPPSLTLKLPGTVWNRREEVQRLKVFRKDALTSGLEGTSSPQASYKEKDFGKHMPCSFF